MGWSQLDNYFLQNDVLKRADQYNERHNYL